MTCSGTKTTPTPKISTPTLPINRLREVAAEGRIGAMSERFYGIPTDYSQRRTQRNDSPRIEEWMRQDGVDVALLVPL